MSGSLFSQKKDTEKFTKVGPFWYPNKFYAAVDDHVMGPIVREYSYSRNNADSYEYMLLVRNLQIPDAFRIRRDFLPEGACFSLNLQGWRRQGAIDAIDDLMNQQTRLAGNAQTAKERRRSGGPEPVRIGPRQVPPVDAGVLRKGTPGDVRNLRVALKAALQPVTDQVGRDYLGEMFTGSNHIFKSPIFWQVHEARVKRFARWLRTKSGFDAEAIAMQPFDECEGGLDFRNRNIGPLRTTSFYQAKYVERNEEKAWREVRDQATGGR